MDLTVGDVFDAETETVPEDVAAAIDRQNYQAKYCEIQAESSKLTSSKDNTNNKLAGDLAYFTKNYQAAIRHYEEYLRNCKSEGGVGTLRDVLEGVTRCYIALNDDHNAAINCDKLVKIGHAQNVLRLR